MFVLAHLSDLHMALTPRLSELAGKRGLGFINWQRGRKYIHRRETLDVITRDVKAAAADHIAVTGDLVNLSLPVEYAAARAWLDNLGPPHDVTVIPGNHDAYVPPSAGRTGEVLGRLYARRRRRRTRHLSVRAPARTGGADRALLGVADRTVHGDRRTR